MQVRWFQSKESTTVVGRIVDHEKLNAKQSRLQNKRVYMTVPVLESKVPGQSNDICVQELKEFNAEELKARFPGAWEFYNEHKSAPKVEQTVVYEVPKGTPLHQADFVPRERQAWLFEQGISTVEQLRDMSDTTVQNLGRGALTWRKKAREFLERT